MNSVFTELTVCAGWDASAYYSVEYVNRLYRSVSRNLTLPFDFVLFIGPGAESKLSLLDSNIRTVQTNLPYWWSGMAAWIEHPPDSHPHKVLYLDLDLVIIGSLDDIVNFPSEHACSRDYPLSYVKEGRAPVGHENDANVGVTLIRNNAGVKVWQEYVKAGMPVWNPLTTFVSKRGTLPLAAQTVVNDPKFGVKVSLFPDNWICSYKYQVLRHGIPDDCRVVHFHGRPKQHEINERWIKENWI